MRAVLASFALSVGIYALGALSLRATRARALGASLTACVAAGLASIYLLLLLRLPLAALPWVLAAAPLIEAGLRLRDGATPRARGLALAGGLAALALPLALVAISTPLESFDARSVWFFRAKMIYFAGGLDADAGLAEPAVAFSHPDYPLLVSELGALAAALAGRWNEVLPKAGLAPLHLLLCVGVAEQRRLPVVARLLLFVALVALRPVQLVNGYVDLWLAAAACLAGGFALAWFARRRARDLICAGLLAALLPSLKNEGALLAGVLTLGVGLLAWRRGVLGEARDALRDAALPLGVALGAALLWWLTRAQWSLDNDLSLLGGDALGRALPRLVDGTALGVLVSLIFSAAMLPWLIAAILATLVTLGDPREGADLLPGALLPLGLAIAYLLALTLVFVATPYDLGWHLRSAADRVVLPAEALLVLSVLSPIARAASPRPT